MKTTYTKNTLFLTFISVACSLLFLAPTVHAQVTILPVPTGDCPKFPTSQVTTIKEKTPDGKEKTTQKLIYQTMQCKRGTCWRCSTLSGKNLDECTKGDIQTTIPCNYTLDDIIKTFINGAKLIFALTGSLALLMFVIGGALMITSSGNPEEYKKGMKILSNSIIAIIITLGASAIVAAAGKWVGANILPTSEVAFTSDCPPRGIQGSKCRNTKDANMVCYYGPDTPVDTAADADYGDGECMSICEYNTSDPNPSLATGYKCVDTNTLSVEGKHAAKCQTDLCPGKSSVQCCDTTAY